MVGCSDSDRGAAGGAGGSVGMGGTGGMPDLEWPPDATAYFDQYGILNADCATDEDCAMVLGYYHAFDRFVQMDLRRRLPTGRLADMFDKGLAQLLEVPAAAAEARALFSTPDGKPIEDQVLEHTSRETLALLEAYSAGVNKWIEHVRGGQNGAKFPREFANAPFTYSPADIPEWTPRDSIAIVLALIDYLNNTEALELNAGAARETIDNDLKFSDLWSRRPGVESSILAPGWKPPATATKRSAATPEQRPSWRESLKAEPALRHLSARMERDKELRHMLFSRALLGSASGSNSWVIAPSRSASGNALLANDMHLAMTQPALWYLAHLDAKTNGSGKIHSAGVTLAGTPSVFVGQNESIAWGGTHTAMDFADVYVEELIKDADGNPTGVMFQGKVVPFTRVPFSVTFKDGSEEQQDLLFVPHHGPVRELDVENNVAITLRWTLQDATTDMNMFTALGMAETLEDARAAVANGTASGGCWVIADTEGDIGYFTYNRVPKRTWATNLSGDAPPWLPLDGRGDYEWTDFWDYSDLPQVVNPTEGFVATANNDITGALFDGDPTNDGYPPLQSDLYAPGFRHARIVELIEELGSEHTAATMQRIQSDVYSLEGELMRPGFIAIAESEMTTLSEPAQKVVNALKAWNFTCPTGLDGPYQDSPPTDDPEVLRESSGCAAFHAALSRCWFPLLLGERGRFDPSFAYFYSIVDPSQLQAGDVYWDNPATTPEIETKYQGIEKCFDEAGRLLMTDQGLGDDETKWAWGRVQGLSLSSDLSTFGISTYDNPPPGETLFANDGGHYTVDPTTPFAPDGVQREGASMRFVCEVFPSGPSCTIQLPGGQSSDIDSPYNNYEDLLFKWLENEPIDLVFDIDEAKANAVRTVTFD